ncbi:MAG TPA: DNA polymerase domain-containing protein [bacterium]|jgi:DNA polymerase elongation subunit (family B)
MVVWLIDGDGRPQRLLYRYHPAMYISGPPSTLGHAEQAIRQARVDAALTSAVQREFMTGEEIPVLRVALRSPLQYPLTARTLARVPGLTLYNCDIALPRLFFYDTGLFPLAWCEVEPEGGVIRALRALNSPEDFEYPLPPLVTMQLRLDTGGATPTHGRRGLLEVSVEGETAVLDGARPEDLITSLNHMLQRYDPDVLLTEWGDSFLLPQLQGLAAQARQSLLLNRDRGQGIRTRRDRSYTTYGQVVFQAGAQMLHGRWHLDFRNSFIYSESELAGLLDIARLSRIPVQELGRTSTGTAISSMQLNQAVRDGILIPWQKSEPEAFKTASQLLLTDKGGLTYQPIVGLFENVGELDFSSMYPMIMSQFNISPETVGCSCCPDSHVPEIGYAVCRRRRGLVPKVLGHLLERRAHYKRRRQETEGESRAIYHQRQTALKWALVTSFGYLGYRNARFGRIEAHESVTAYSREMLLRAKEVAEERGYRMLHALVDSMWLHKPGAGQAEYDALAREVTAATGLPIYVEGVYRWIGFLPSRIHRGVGVPNRYLGLFEDGSTKVRGIEVRRSDVPIIVERMQTDLLQRMFRCRTLADVQAAMPELLTIIEGALVLVRSGEVTAAELAITNHLSQEPAAYVANSAQAIAARTLSRHGARLHPGEAIQYIITDRNAKLPADRVRPYTLLGSDWHYDAAAYADLLLRAAETVLELFGYPRDRLREEVWQRVQTGAPSVSSNRGSVQNR